MTGGGRQRPRLTATVTDLEVRRQRAFLIAAYNDDREERLRSLIELALLTATAGSDPIESERVGGSRPGPAGASAPGRTGKPAVSGPGVRANPNLSRIAAGF